MGGHRHFSVTKNYFKIVILNIHDGVLITGLISSSIMSVKDGSISIILLHSCSIKETYVDIMLTRYSIKEMCGHNVDEMFCCSFCDKRASYRIIAISNFSLNSST